MSPRDKTKSNRKPGRDLNVVFAEKSGQNQVFGMATLAEYKTRNIFWTFLLSAYPGKKVLKMSTGMKQLNEFTWTKRWIIYSCNSLSSLAITFKSYVSSSTT